MKNLQFSWMTLGLATSVMFGVTACQPEAATLSESNEVKTAQETDQKATIAAKPATVSKPTVAAKTCLELSKSMQKVDETSKIDAIYNIQKVLETCLPTANNAEVLRLLADYQAMYGRFLTLNHNMEDDNFYTVMSMADEGKKVPAPLLKTLNPRLKYLIGLVEDGADVRVIYLGEGYYAFTHDLQAMADIFTPYLRQDQKAFIDRLAMDNQDILWNDGGIAISFAELMQRAVFWEDYIARYPRGYAYQDAKQLSQTYRYLLFFGSNNTQWTDDTIHEFIAPEYRPLMLKLARRPNSVLARDAQTLLDFMALSDSQRQERYPTPDLNENGDEIDEWAIPRYQLAKALLIESPWQADNKNCFAGIVCVENEIE